ncbi:pentapeptide repeat-containing protein [Rhodococcoides fascians]|uniref:pentapeptide repeat-containing protein n=1 Tax=Rhodococcoides fascians TaxID=1828 RepID=UPI0022A8A3AC|nr:pentapeptide repeat-containing protein [Rhodococcus fascians]
MNESQVNDAIISQFAVRLNKQSGAWRGLGLVLDLHGADLSKSLWSNLDLRRAIFNGADMRDIDLRGCLLAGADLTRAQLEKADVSGSDLTTAQLAKAVPGQGYLTS